MVFRRVVFALTSASKIFPTSKEEEKIKPGKSKEGTFPQSGLSASETPMKKDMAAPKNQTIGLPVIGLTIPELQMLGAFEQRLILHGRWQLH